MIKEVSDKNSFGKNGFKLFIGYKDYKKVKSLYVMHPKMSEYSRKHDGETEYMFLLIIEDDK